MVNLAIFRLPAIVRKSKSFQVCIPETLTLQDVSSWNKLAHDKICRAAAEFVFLGFVTVNQRISLYCPEVILAKIVSRH